MVAVAMLCLVAQLGALVHLLAVRHERCAEHGELVHAAEAADHANPREPSAVAQVLPASDSEAAHDDHCQGLSELRDCRADRAPTFEHAAIEYVPAPWRGATASTVTRSLYRLAPKISPPAHA